MYNSPSRVIIISNNNSNIGVSTLLEFRKALNYQPTAPLKHTLKVDVTFVWRLQLVDYTMGAYSTVRRLPALGFQSSFSNVQFI